jgi:hypothetical protein
MDFEEGAKIVSLCYSAISKREQMSREVVLRFEKGRN